MPFIANTPMHRIQTRVYYAETDAGGVVYHAAYLNYAERARVEFMRDLGFSVADLTRDHGLIFAVRHCDIDFSSPARLDDALEITSEIVEIGGASIRFRQVINKTGMDAAKPLVVINVTLVAINKDAKACRIPDFLREKISIYAPAMTGKKGEE